MATTDSLLLNGASGMIGNKIVYKKYHDKTVVSKKPDMSRRVLSEKQLESNERLRLANIYARYHYSTEDRKDQARLRLGLQAHKSLFHALVKEHLNQSRKLPLEELQRTFRNDA